MTLLFKVILSALLIGGISEIARRNSAIAALLASLPLISILSMIWIYHDTHDVARIAAFSWSVVWYVLPSLLLFILLPVFLLRFHWPFYWSLAMASVATILGFFLLKLCLRPFGVIL